MASTAIPLDEIQKPTFKTYSLRELCERLDPDMYADEVEYEFTGRQFKRPVKRPS